MPSASRASWSPGWGTGVAVTAVLMLALAIGVLMPARPDATWLSAELINHVRGEPGGRLIGSLGKVTHIAQCRVPGGMGQHLVVETARGRVTLILMPGQPLDARTQLTRGGLTGVVLPAGRGSAGVVAESPEALREVEDAVRRRIAWP